MSRKINNTKKLASGRTKRPQNINKQVLGIVNTYKSYRGTTTRRRIENRSVLSIGMGWNRNFSNWTRIERTQNYSNWNKI